MIPPRRLFLKAGVRGLALLARKRKLCFCSVEGLAKAGAFAYVSAKRDGAPTSWELNPTNR